MYEHNYWSKKFNLTKEDSIKAILYFKTISYISYFAIFGVCYRFRPGTKFLKTELGKKLLSNVKNTFPKITHKIEIDIIKFVDTISKNKYVHMILSNHKDKAKGITESMVETTIIYKLSLPIYFYFTYKYAKKIEESNILNLYSSIFIYSTNSNMPSIILTAIYKFKANYSANIHNFRW